MIDIESYTKNLIDNTVSIRFLDLTDDMAYKVVEQFEEFIEKEYLPIYLYIEVLLIMNLIRLTSYEDWKRRFKSNRGFSN